MKSDVLNDAPALFKCALFCHEVLVAASPLSSQSWPHHPSPTSLRAPWDQLALTRCWSTTLGFVSRIAKFKGPFPSSTVTSHCRVNTFVHVGFI